MSDPLIERLKENVAVLEVLADDRIVLLALSELMAEMAFDKDVPPGTKAKRISLAAELTKRAGVRW